MTRQMHSVKFLKILIGIILSLSGWNKAFGVGNSELPPEVYEMWSADRNDFLIKNQRSLAELLNSSDELYGIELIIAGPIDHQIESRFGHSLLRFVGSGRSPINDKVLSFGADIDEPILSYAKAVVGSYAIIAEVQSFGEFIKRYVENENRSLSRYIIPTTPEMRKNLIAKLRERVENPHKMGRYKYFTNNCVGALLAYLRDSNIPVIEQKEVPSMLPWQMESQYLSPYPALVTSTSMALLNDLATGLKVPVNQLRAGHWPRSAIPLLQTLDVARVTQLFYESPPSDPIVRQEMKRRIQEAGTVQLERVYKLMPLPKVAYGLCDNLQCASEVVKGFESIGINIKLMGMVAKSKAEVGRRFLSLTASPLQHYIRHLQFLNEAVGKN
jgi:hypothetical protein